MITGRIESLEEEVKLLNEKVDLLLSIVLMLQNIVDHYLAREYQAEIEAHELSSFEEPDTNHLNV